MRIGPRRYGISSESSLSTTNGRAKRRMVPTRSPWCLLVYDHDSSSLAQKLTHIQHEHHKSVVSSLHVHLDEHNCLEVLILRGRASEIIAMGESLVSTKGVRYGKVVPATTGRHLK